MRRKEILLLAVILLIGGFLRLFHLGTMFFNGDEPLNQIRISYQPFAYVLKYNNGPLFSLLVHFLLPLGSLELAARFVPFVSGLLTIVLTYFLGKALFSKAAGLMAAFMAASSHLLIFYSQNSRTYAPMTLFFLLAFLYLYKAVRERKARFWFWYGLTLCLFLYSHTVAFLVLPPLALYIVSVWLERKKEREPGGRGLFRSPTVRRFLVSTLAATVAAAALYLPCAWVVDMFRGSLSRGFSHPADSVALTLRGIFDILRVQISPSIAGIFFLTLALFVLGFFYRSKRHGREYLLIGTIVVFPWLVFVLGKPRAKDLYSLYRYLLFLLPLIFLMASRGIEPLASGAEALFARGKARRASAVRALMQIGLAALLAWGFFSSLRDYHYSDYWRQGSFPLDREVKALFEDKADRDALLYVDAYPVSSLILMMNPLTRDQRPEDTEIAARPEFVRAAGPGPVMVYVEEFPFFLDHVASRKVELWALTARTPEKIASLRAAGARFPGLETFELPEWIVLHSKKDDRSLAEKMALLADELLTWPDGDAVLRRQRRLFAAQAFTMTRDVRDAIREVRSFEENAVEPGTEAANAGSTAERILGGFLGFSPRKLREFYERRTLADVQNLFLMLGNNLIDAGHLVEASLAYGEILHIGPKLDEKVRDRLVVLGDRFEQAGQPDHALTSWTTASRLGPEREDISSRIARLRGKTTKGK